ncbi:MAG: hypothetical protein ABIP79_16665 [Chitinophagaceae bacterium]
MKIKHILFLSVVFFTVLFAGCTDNNQSKTETKESQPQKEVTTDTRTSDLQAPDLADPVLKEYYSSYTTYLNNVIAAIRDKDETRAMKLFSEEGKKFNDNNNMEKKAQAADAQKFNTWLMQSMKYQSEIVQSDYYKKFNEEYYKKVKENFEKKGN